MREPTSRRVFLTEGAAKYQILSFTQRQDASFYVNCPNFARSRWVEIIDVPDGGAKTVAVSDAPGDGKLSVHASGFAGIRAHEATGHYVVVRGNMLANMSAKHVQPRHLLSVMTEEPHHVPAGVRQSDYVLTGKKMKPLAFVFFAVPAIGGLEVNIQFSMHVDEIGEPPDISWGLMTFPIHGVIWLAYSTKSMEQWPPSTHFCHHDGFTVPMFMGSSKTECKFAAVRPTYSYANNKLGINLSVMPPDAAAR